MATYLILNVIFIAITLATFKIFKALSWNKIMTYLLILLLVLTIIFDSLIIAAGIVDYDPNKILGLKIGLAPIEDFMYAILALIIIPSVWKKLEASNV